MNNNGHNYSVHKSVKVLHEQTSGIDRNYWVEGGMTAENAKSLAENLALIDRQTLGQLAMRELEVFYVVVNDDTHKVVCKYNMVEGEYMKTILIWCMLDNMFGQYDGHTKREMEYKVASRVEDIRDQLMYQLATNAGLNYPTYEMFVKYIIKNFPDVVKWDKEKENWIDAYTGEVL